MIDLAKPLVPLIAMLNDKNVRVGVHLRYDKLKIFCYSCGKVGNRIGQCPEYSGGSVSLEDEDRVMQEGRLYGPRVTD